MLSLYEFFGFRPRFNCIFMLFHREDIRELELVFVKECIIVDVVLEKL